MSIVLNRNEGVSVLHPDAGDQCAPDDSDGRITVDESTARGLLDTGQATLCHHCGAEGIPDAPETAA